MKRSHVRWLLSTAFCTVNCTLDHVGVDASVDAKSDVSAMRDAAPTTDVLPAPDVLAPDVVGEAGPACDAAMNCVSATPCRTAAIDCASGAPVCEDTGNSPEGTACEREGGAAGFCSVAGTCDECTTDAQCGAGRVCGGGMCVAGCSATSPCAGGQTCCAGACVDTQTNTDHCGACGRVCAAANGVASCAGATCALAACNEGFENCDGDAGNGCETAINTATNCGGCGRACSDGTPVCDTATLLCIAACADGQTRCGMSCANTKTDAANCGACGRACPAAVGGTAFCSASICGQSCPAGQSNCRGTCRATGGACTSAGTGGCQNNGVVQCSGTTTSCSATPRTSGACTTPAGGTCNASGTCVAPAPRTFICGYARAGSGCDSNRINTTIAASSLAAAITACSMMRTGTNDFCGVMADGASNTVDQSQCAARMGQWCRNRPYCRFLGSTGSVCGARRNEICNCP